MTGVQTCALPISVFAYVRQLESERILVICNWTDQELIIRELEPWQKGRLLLGNYMDEEERSRLRPYEAKIVKEDVE